MGCSTLPEMFNYLSNFYNISGTIPGPMKFLVVSGIVTALQWVKASKKNMNVSV
jgi:hypothetical protein